MRLITTHTHLYKAFLSLSFLLVTTNLLVNAANAAPDSATGFLLVANKGDQTLGIVDPAAGREIATIPEDGITGHEVVASPDGKLAFVPIYGSGGVGSKGTDGSLMRVIDLSKREIVHTVDFGKGVRPHCAVFNAQNNLLYVTSELENSITAIDPKTFTIVGTIPTGQPESHMLAVTRDGSRGYTANVAPGTVSVLDLKAEKLLTIIPVARTVQRISLSTDDRWVFTSDQNQPRLAVIDTETNGVRSWVEMPGTGYGSAPTPDGRWLLIAIPGKNKVAAVNLETLKVEHTFDVPRAPQEVLIRPDGGEAYVSCDASRQIAVMNLKDWKVDKLIDAGRSADGLAWAKAVE